MHDLAHKHSHSHSREPRARELRERSLEHGRTRDSSRPHDAAATLTDRRGQGDASTDLLTPLGTVDSYFASEEFFIFNARRGCLVVALSLSLSLFLSHTVLM